MIRKFEISETAKMVAKCILKHGLPLPYEPMIST
jgi:hypothetical protein